MTSLTETICMKRWHAYGLIALSGFAIGNILAKTLAALGS